MSALKRITDTYRRMGPWPMLRAERLLASERAAALLEGRRWPNGARVAALRNLRRLVATALGPSAPVPSLAPLLDQALKVDRRSMDRAIILTYFRLLPSDHPEFDQLRAAAETAANRHDWHWKTLGEQHRLWSPTQTSSGAWDLDAAAKSALQARNERSG